jgi:hypothetical protein
VADFTFNIAKGRIGEFLARVDANEPASSAIILVPLAASGTAAQGQTLDTLAQVEAHAAFAEQTHVSWGRKVLEDTHFLTTDHQPDDVANAFDSSLPQVVWASPALGQDTTGLLVCYAPDKTGADSTFIPLTHHDFYVSGDGGPVVLNPGLFLKSLSLTLPEMSIYPSESLATSTSERTGIVYFVEVELPPEGSPTARSARVYLVEVELPA